MTKYIVAFHDNDNWDTWVVTFMAKSFKDCEYEVMEYISNYLKDDSLLNIDYSDFLEKLDESNISMSCIYDIEEL